MRAKEMGAAEQLDEWDYFQLRWVPNQLRSPFEVDPERALRTLSVGIDGCLQERRKALACLDQGHDIEAIAILIVILDRGPKPDPQPEGRTQW